MDPLPRWLQAAGRCPVPTALASPSPRRAGGCRALLLRATGSATKINGCGERADRSRGRPGARGGQGRQMASRRGCPRAFRGPPPPVLRSFSTPRSGSRASAGPKPRSTGRDPAGGAPSRALAARERRTAAQRAPGHPGATTLRPSAASRRPQNIYTAAPRRAVPPCRRHAAARAAGEERAGGGSGSGRRAPARPHRAPVGAPAGGGARHECQKRERARAHCAASEAGRARMRVAPTREESGARREGRRRGALSACRRRGNLDQGTPQHQKGRFGGAV
jgi:hypothetical protein